MKSLDGLSIMSESQSLQRILATAREEEEKYDWLEAAKSYEEALQ